MKAMARSVVAMIDALIGIVQEIPLLVCKRPTSVKRMPSP